MIKKILILYKQSTYHYYFLNRFGTSMWERKNKAIASRFIDTHHAHYRTLEKVEEFLKAEGFHYNKVKRGEKRNYSEYDLIITVGGDGTFLEAASIVDHQLVLGVNSDPKWSVGRFCAATPDTFPKIFHNIISRKFKVRCLNRMQVNLKQSQKSAVALNDILVCHRNPAAMIRYSLEFRKKREDQRSSGVWIATAAGSTGAIRSAGGKVLPEKSKKLQFVVRELYHDKSKKARIVTSVFEAKENFKIKTLNTGGMIYIDGSHRSLPFPFGEELTVQNAQYPLCMVIT